MDDRTAIARPNVLRWASRPTDDAEQQQLFKRRLLLSITILMCIACGLYAVGLLFVGLLDASQLWAVHTHPSKLAHLAVVIAIVGQYIALKRAPARTSVLEAFDTAGLFTVSIGIGIGAWFAPSGFHLEFALLVGYLFGLVVRAALVPSSAKRTAVLGVLCSIPMLIGTSALAQRSPGTELITPPLVALGLVIWCAAAVVATTLVSHTIYGLVSQVREAQQLGQYTLREKVGEGGMGEVYRAEHAMLRRPTAIKLLLPSRVSPEGLLRFEREVQLTSQLSHPNTIVIYDYGRTAQGVFYYAMEFLEGFSLDALVRQDGPQPAGLVVRMALQVAGALGEAHGIGLIHRDIKPSNIMLCERGGGPVVKVFDFGLVKKLDGAGDDVALTGVHSITGTPLYLAPEAITHASEVDGRVDIYALGALMYFLLTGAPPFDGRTVVEICGHHLHTQPVPPSRRLGHAIPPRLEALVLACLAKSPDDRPRDARALSERLAECELESPFGAAELRDWWMRLRAERVSGQSLAEAPTRVVA